MDIGCTCQLGWIVDRHLSDCLLMNEHGTGLNDTVCREGVSYSEALQALLNLIDETDVVYIMHNKVGLFQISEEGFQTPPRVAKRKRGIV